ncbi:fimbrial protein [Paraburkholderia sabiae]|uniref:Fimbrial protein n=1 Tax=Paraburkholderia sabiae TaxID=273251 RepID=A0ABU9QKH5_9BURK|nr:fimbrial protein [Paraburkholderia sabiae]WJZ71919.1 fimbrial protein [Paraburkholderia sabiae]CAD6517849.1 hypothetical protein LMG24235_01015 [Paraburkholderia sabiae]
MKHLMNVFFSASRGVRTRSAMAAACVTRMTAVLLLMLVGSQAMAAGTITFPASANLTFPASIAVSRDMPVGTVLSSQAVNVGLSASGVTCNVQKDVTVNGMPVPGNPLIYQTGAHGIGVHFYITSGWNGSWVDAPVSQTLTTPTGSTAHYLRADLVVSGAVSPGTVVSLPSMTVTFSGSCITTVSGTLTLTTGTAITVSSCSVTTPQLTFNLPKVYPKDLANTGATADDTTLPLTLNCPAGVKVAVTITDATTPTNRSTTLTLPRGSASGVGLQLLNGSTVIAYGPDSAVAGTTNQWSAGTATGGAMQIPLTARYVRTSGQLTPGSVSGVATFTMSYQ